MLSPVGRYPVLYLMQESVTADTLIVVMEVSANKVRVRRIVNKTKKASSTVETTGVSVRVCVRGQGIRACVSLPFVLLCPGFRLVAVSIRKGRLILSDPCPDISLSHTSLPPTCPVIPFLLSSSPRSRHNSNTTNTCHFFFFSCSLSQTPASGFGEETSHVVSANLHLGLAVDPLSCSVAQFDPILFSLILSCSSSAEAELLDRDRYHRRKAQLDRRSHPADQSLEGQLLKM